MKLLNCLAFHSSNFEHQASNLLLVLLFLFTISFAHAYFINGTVKDTEGQPIPEVYVETPIKTVRTDNNGAFTLNLMDKEERVTFGRIGYSLKTITIISSDKPLTIILYKEPVIIGGFHVEDMYSSDMSSRMKEKRVIQFRNSFTDIPSMLSHQGNFIITGMSLAGEKQSLSLLGFKSRHVSVSLDGIQLNTSGEDFDLSSIPLESIERMELLQSNTSSLVGSGGMGGMLNLYSKQYGNEGTSDFKFTFAAGSLGYQKQGYQSFLTTPLLQTMIFYNRMNSNNDFSYKTTNQDGDNVSLKRIFNHKYLEDIMIHVGFTQKEWNVRYACDYQNFDKQLPGPVNFLLVYRDANIQGETLRQSLDVKYGNETTEYNLVLYQNRENTFYDNTHAPLSVYYIQSRNELKKNGSHARWKKMWFDLKFHSFLEYWKEGYTYEEPTFSAHDIPQKAQTLLAGGGQIDYIHETVFFNYHGVLNGRIDHREGFEHFETYRLSGDITYKSWSDITVGGSYGTGFTLPSFYSLYWKGDAQAGGNADLKPESSKGWQVYGKWKLGEHSLLVNYHQNQFDDMILWIQSYQWGGVWKPVNIAKAEMKTVICDVNVKPLSYLSLNTSFTFTSAYDRSLLPNGEHSAFFGKHLVYQPETLLRCGALLDGKRQFLHLFYNYTGRQWTKTDNLLPPLKAYGIVDAEAGYKFMQKHWNEIISVNANNLLCHRYEIYPYIPQPGFNWQVQMNITYTIR